MFQFISRDTAAAVASIFLLPSELATSYLAVLYEDVDIIVLLAIVTKKEQNDSNKKKKKNN